MQTVLLEYREFSRVYVADIIIFSSAWEPHLAHIRKVLQS